MRTSSGRFLPPPSFSLLLSPPPLHSLSGCLGFFQRFFFWRVRTRFFPRIMVDVSSRARLRLEKPAVHTNQSPSNRLEFMQPLGPCRITDIRCWLDVAEPMLGWGWQQDWTSWLGVVILQVVGTSEPSGEPVWVPVSMPKGWMRLCWPFSYSSDVRWSGWLSSLRHRTAPIWLNNSDEGNWTRVAKWFHWFSSNSWIWSNRKQSNFLNCGGFLEEL